MNRKTSKQVILASLLGDNPNRAFSFDELKRFIRSYSQQSIYMLVLRLREAGMSIEVKNKLVTYVKI